jgi:stress-induced morphogen
MLNIVDESHKHAGHSGNPSGSPDAETHFKWVASAPDAAAEELGAAVAVAAPAPPPGLQCAATCLLSGRRQHGALDTTVPAGTLLPPRRVEIVSEAFQGKRLVQRHQMVSGNAEQNP